ncbi:uncharacterized protein LOC128396144 [Panonychus citri]|uniref:uncharacterized protein LOC128396144 n=1 Tax=Panonychus citri TaxID=50023 RepID=UPI0023073FD9|nr:uncharacterized protein LOC128396144 [Panonychus citri]
MATFLFDGDELRECPYNPNHRVLSKRLLSHMGKCANEPGAPVLEVCPFNSLHRVYPHEYAAHSVECPDNRQAIRELLNPVANPVNSQSNNQQSEIVDDEWESITDDKYLLKGLDEKEEEVGGNAAFLPQHHLYRKKPAERKRLYNQLTEDAIRRKAQGEREQLTEEEASELGLSTQRTDYIIDIDGERTETSEEATEPEINLNAGPSGQQRTTETDQESDEKEVKIKKQDEDEDNKEEVKRLIQTTQLDCFKSREVRR